MSRFIRKWYLSHRWRVKAQADHFRIRESLCYSHTQYTCMESEEGSDRVMSLNPIQWLHMCIWRISNCMMLKLLHSRDTSNLIFQSSAKREKGIFLGLIGTSLRGGFSMDWQTRWSHEQLIMILLWKANFKEVSHISLHYMCNINLENLRKST